MSILFIISRETLLKCSVSIFDFIKSHLKFQIAINLRLQESFKSVPLFLELLTRLSHLLIYDFSRDLLDVDVAFSKLL